MKVIEHAALKVSNHEANVESVASLFERDDDSQIFDAIIKSETDTRLYAYQKIFLRIVISRYRSFSFWHTFFILLLTPSHFFVSVARTGGSSFSSLVLLIGKREEIEQNQGG